MTTLPAAVLWDMDGTLVDTEPYWIDSEWRLVEEHGGTWSEEHAHALVGNPLLVSGAYIAEHGPVPLTPEEIVDRLVADVIRRMRERLPLRPGALELLEALRADGVPCALVTMSYRSLAEAAIEALPAGLFDVIVPGDEVTHGKPHPEPYLVAAAKLGVDPEACVAIEDSPTGVASAVAAGAHTLGVEHLVPIGPGPGRTVITTLEGWTPGRLGALTTPAAPTSRGFSPGSAG